MEKRRQKAAQNPSAKENKERRKMVADAAREATAETKHHRKVARDILRQMKRIAINNVKLCKGKIEIRRQHFAQI